MCTHISKGNNSYKLLLFTLPLIPRLSRPASWKLYSKCRSWKRRVWIRWQPASNIEVDMHAVSITCVCLVHLVTLYRFPSLEPYEDLYQEKWYHSRWIYSETPTDNPSTTHQISCSRESEELTEKISQHTKYSIYSLQTDWILCWTSKGMETQQLATHKVLHSCFPFQSMTSLTVHWNRW